MRRFCMHCGETIVPKDEESLPGNRTAPQEWKHVPNPGYPLLEICESIGGPFPNVPSAV